MVRVRRDYEKESNASFMNYTLSFSKNKPKKKGGGDFRPNKIACIQIGVKEKKITKIGS